MIAVLVVLSTAYILARSYNGEKLAKAFRNVNGAQYERWLRFAAVRPLALLVTAYVIAQLRPRGRDCMVDLSEPKAISKANAPEQRNLDLKEKLDGSSAQTWSYICRVQID